MSPRFKPLVRAQEAVAPYNRFDSQLALPTRRNDLLKQNGWLTLTMRIHLNFVDAFSPAAYIFDNNRGTVTRRSDEFLKTWNKSTFAKDWNGNYFRIQNWSYAAKAMFRKRYAAEGQSRWNYRFLLKAPSRYSGLDIDYNFDVKVRPNLICLFRLKLVALSGNPHHVINVVSLDPTANPSVPLNGGTFRSDAANYDDQDLLNPGYAPVSPALGTVRSDTVGHEIGHALGQGHILELLGTPCVSPDAAIAGNECSGTTDFEKANIMAWGNRIYLVNAISWRRRVVHHCSGTTVGQWEATQNLNTLPKKVAAPAKR